MSIIYDEPRVQDTPSAPERPYVWPPEPPERPTTRLHRSHRGRLVAAAVAAALVLGVTAESVPPGTPGHLLWTAIASGAPLSAPAIAPVAPQVDPQLAAIQTVIQRANAEQVQAIANQNPSVMSDTATPAHYQQLVQINQNLVAQGVSSIKLASLTWGPITINGTTATATSYETWVTTFSDSTTMQSTDTNVYTLVQQNGSWIIQDDQQPASPSAAGSGQPSSPQSIPGAPTQPGATAPSVPSAPAPVAPVAPISPSAQGTSHNWSGYAATGGSFTSVTGTWTVPQLSATGAPGVGATWVGIGGVSSRDLIQAGTQDVSAGNGQSQFQAWIETLPAPSQQVPLAVAPGDSITVTINQQAAGGNTWQIAFKNNTSGQTYQTSVRYASSLSSAEWIEEAPSGPNGIVPIDNFGTVGFSGATAIQNGQTVNLAQAGAQPITLLNGNSQPLAVPSGIGSDGSSFSVARTSASATPAPANSRRPGVPLN